MRFESIIRRAMFACSAVLLATVCAFAPSAFAQKGGSGSGTTGGGKIFYIDTHRETNYLWEMASDGSAKTEVGKWGYFAVPSRALHGSFRWYITVLTIPGEFYPNGTTPRSEVFAIRGDYDHVNNNNSETRIRLTDDPMVQPLFPWFQGAHWLPGDAKISFKAKRWMGTAPVDGGIFTAVVSYRADGNVDGLASTPSLAIAFPVDANGSLMLGGHSWDPTGTQVVYVTSTAPGLWVANTSTGTQTRIYDGGGNYPDWSPDNTKIVFSLGSSIWTIKPGGTGLKEIIKPFYRWPGFGHPYFSPTGSHITCVGITDGGVGGPQSNDVIRTTSAGGGWTNLTNTPTINEVPIAWK